jgi:hypothetical protein
MHSRSWRFFLFYGSIIIFFASAFSLTDFNAIFLPGTQPGVVQTFDTPTYCQTCHQTQAGQHTVTITADWKGSMMAHSAQDPIFYAAVAVANKYSSGSGEFCIRCHSPTGWLEGRSNPPTGQALTGNDLNGVQCDACHRMKDPMIPDSTSSIPVPGYGNGMFVAQVPRSPKRGPYTDATNPFHTTQADSFFRSGNFCGVCHTVSNPLYATDPNTQSPHLYSPIERTHSEWLLSWYGAQGEAGTCQSCHMPPQVGYGCTLAMSPQRSDLPKHDLTGGNTFVPDILADFWTLAADTAQIAAGKQRAIQTLQSAANLELIAYRQNDTVKSAVRVTNLTGHKLTTGYPEGRRMWLNIVGRNANGDTLFQSGAYDFETADLTLDPQVKVYETKPGLTATRAAQYGLAPGPSFHFVLNDTIFFDNRIPPRGFTNAAFENHLAQPVGYSYADDQYWDNTTYKLPTTVTQVTSTLYYQTASKEYITFLRDENIGNINDWRAWGDSLYSAWSRHVKSRPVVMNTLTVQVQDSSTGFTSPEDNLPGAITLSQNYPNPFNPSTTIEFAINKAAYVTLRVYDLLGRDVVTLFKGRLQPEKHRIAFDASGLPSGMYFYALVVNNEFRETKKLLIVR